MIPPCIMILPCIYSFKAWIIAKTNAAQSFAVGDFPYSIA